MMAADALSPTGRDWVFPRRKFRWEFRRKSNWFPAREFSRQLQFLLTESCDHTLIIRPVVSGQRTWNMCIPLFPESSK